MVEVLRQLTRKDVLLDLLLIDRESSMSGGNPSHSDHEAIKCKISS